jgi:predicted  nucleic acid-binding Zn-ribbon protein
VNEADLSAQFLAMRKEIEEFRRQFETIEARVMRAENEARAAREEILGLRDQLVAAERDQQDLRTARAKLARLSVRRLLARLLNRE